MTDSDIIQIVLMGLLVVVTGIYAWRTFAISNATKKQADASVKVAEEMREQRYSESLPLLVPTILPPMGNAEGLDPNEVDYLILQVGVGAIVKITWCNVGKGVAVNSSFSFWAVSVEPGKVFYFPPRESAALEVGGRKEINFGALDVQTLDQPKSYCPRLEAEYKDIYGRKIRTVQEFRIDEQNERAFLGELYFIINDRRLGEEVIRHD